MDEQTMPLLVNNAELEEELIADRRARGIDQFDEVWDGVYVMVPLADDEHQEIQARLAIVLGLLVEFTGVGKIRAGSNISNRRTDWTRNFRVPDMLVFLNNTAAENQNTVEYENKIKHTDETIAIPAIHFASPLKFCRAANCNAPSAAPIPA